MHHCKSFTRANQSIHHHHHHHHRRRRNHFFHKFTSISTSNTHINRHPTQQFHITMADNTNIGTYRFMSDVLRDCISFGDLRMANAVHTQLINLDPKGLMISLWNQILNLNCQCGRTWNARKLFESMPERDTVSYNTLISAYARRDQGVVECMQLYFRMQEECVGPNHITVSALIGASAMLRDLYLVEMMHGFAIQCGLSSNEFVGSSLVDAYAKRARLGGAVRAFEEISEADLVSWNVMINGCACNGSKELALCVFSRMRREGLPLNSFTLASMTKICSEPSDLSRGLQLHVCIVKAGLQHETPVSNALITMYSKCEGGMQSAKNIFDRMPGPNVISWTAMISGFMQNGESEDAVCVYQRMLRADMRENEFSFASILPAYSSLARLEQGMQVHARIIKSRFGLDLSVENALIDMYSKCGSLADAKRVFMTMRKHDIVSWTAIITGFGQHGKAREALEILDAMTSEGFKPDAVTFLGVLSACSHGGLVDEGLRVFRSMIDDHGVKPHMRHYACVVDTLGRAGRLNEATKFIEDMGIQSDGLVWEALLSACRIHGEVELGARAAENLMQLKPRKDGAYVLLANLYADKGLWEDKGKVRERLDSSQLKKDTGHSWVAL